MGGDWGAGGDREFSGEGEDGDEDEDGGGEGARLSGAGGKAWWSWMGWSTAAVKMTWV